MAASPWVINVTAETFQQAVVAASHERPVVIDFWAPWCRPCRLLAPKLEALAVARDGGFLLAKVNSDENPELAEAFQVEGIPAVYAIRNGKLVDRFTGMLEDEQLAAFIDRLAPTEAETATRSAFELEGRDPKAAEAAYRELLTANPTDPASRLGLARVLLASTGREVEAGELLTGSNWGDDAAEVARLRAVVQLREVPHGEGELKQARVGVAANAEDANAQFQLGAVLAARGEYTNALEALLAAAEADRTIGRGPIRELMVKVFEVIGPRSPEADEYRNKLRMVLY